MEIKHAARQLAALGSEKRLAIYRRLVESGPDGLSAGSIAEQQGLAPATLSFHLAHLSRAGLVTARQDSRFIYYAADFTAMNALIGFLTDNCCQGQACGIPTSTPQKEPPIMTTYNVLFLCTGNSARSILAEATLNHVGEGRFRAFSAGSHPTGKVNPFAIELLARQGIEVKDIRSKSWDEFAAPDTPPLDFIFTVCDNAAGEVCPIWPGKPMTAHWGVEDPAAVQGSDEDKRKAFFKAYNELHRRIALFASLPLAKLDRLAIKTELDRIGTT